MCLFFYPSLHRVEDTIRTFTPFAIFPVLCIFFSLYYIVFFLFREWLLRSWLYVGSSFVKCFETGFVIDWHTRQLAQCETKLQHHFAYVGLQIKKGIVTENDDPQNPQVWRPRHLKETNQISTLMWKTFCEESGWVTFSTLLMTDVKALCSLSKEPVATNSGLSGNSGVFTGQLTCVQSFHYYIIMEKTKLGNKNFYSRHCSRVVPSNGLTFWEIRFFAFLPGVRWEDQHHHHISPVKYMATASSRLA